MKRFFIRKLNLVQYKGSPYYVGSLPYARLKKDNLIEIKTEENKRYYVPVENSAEFIELVTEYVNEYRMKNGLEELKIEDNFSI